jgi:alpha-soluble NSF attachment protein
MSSDKSSKKQSGADKLKALQKAGAEEDVGSAEDHKSQGSSIYNARDYGANDHLTDERADSLVKEAEKKLKKPAIFADRNRYETCLELFDQAGQAYRLNENYTEAANAYTKAAELAENKLKSDVEASNFYCKAARCLVNSDMDDALQSYYLAVAINMNSGKIDSAAKIWRDIAAILIDENRLAEALEAFQKSATCHEACDTLPSAVQCYLEMADLYGKNEDYAEAAEMYKKAAQVSIEKNINNGSHQDWFYKAILCEFLLSARSDFTTELPRQSYKAAVKVNRRFEGTKKFDLLKKLFDCFDNEDLDEFESALRKHAKVEELDDFAAKILLRIKQQLKAGPRDDHDDDSDFDPL